MKRLHIEENILKQKYIDENLTIPEMAEFFDCGKTTIIRKLNAYSITKPVSLKFENISKKAQIRAPDYNKAEVIRLYVQENWTAKNISTHLQMSLNAVNKILSKSNSRKTKAQQKQNQIKILVSRNDFEALYLNPILTIDEIAKRLKISASSVSLLAKNFKLTKPKKPRKPKPIRSGKKAKPKKQTRVADYDWLKENYIDKNRKVKDIAKDEGVSMWLIGQYIKQFQLKKDKESILANVFDTKKKLGLMTDIQGMQIEAIAKKYDVSLSHAYKVIKKFNIDSIEKVEEVFSTLKENQMNSLEYKVSQALSLPFFNKQATNAMKYKPDFQLNDKTYINVDGLYWHSELQVPNKYHFDMRQQYENHDLRILQFREDEVNEKLDIIASMVNNILCKNTKIFARKTKLQSVTQKQARDFLDKNHMMGSTTAKHIGLFYNEDLVMLVSYKMFGRVLKIERMCSKTHVNVVGGFSKLLKYLEKTLNPKQIDYWVDLRYGTGNFLKTLGFIHKRDTLGWRWTDGLTTYNRRRIRANMDKDNLKEREYANKLGVIKIYDAGQRLFVKNV